MVAIYIAIAVLSGILMTLMLHKFVQMLQLSSYRVKGFCGWIKSSRFDYPIRFFVLTLFSSLSLAAFWAAFEEYSFVGYFGFLIVAGFCIAFIIITMRQKNKTPLKMTARVKRLFGVLGVINVILAFIIVFTSRAVEIGDVYLSYTLIAGMPMVGMFTIFPAHLIMLPFEILNNRRYYRMAQKKLEGMPDLIKVGITGSYGKTTVKNILAEMLCKKFNVCYSPASYNTPMGLSKVINYELEPTHEVLIAEMGARRIGDIKELCDLVKPTVSMLTAIGLAHLDTFGSRENIAKGKYEIIENVADGGLKVFNAMGGAIKPLIEKTDGRKAVSGIKGTEGATCVYSKLKFGTEGCEFVLSAGETKDSSVKIKTTLLGKYIPDLICMCAAVAVELGVSLGDIAAACKSLKPVPHRLELIKSGNTAILDDAYNSNPDGARSAIEVLGCFEGTKIIVTPGIVEMGEDEELINTELGKDIAKVCDYAILVGSRADCISEGCKEGGMAEDKIIKTNSLTEATEKLAGIVPNEKRAVLFENDLPDNIK